jgi:signal peptidase II
MTSLISRSIKYRLLLIVAVVILLSDQGTKFWVTQTIPYGTYLNPIPVIDGFLYWVHIGNTGAAWGMLQGFGLLLGIFAIITIAVIFAFRRVLLLHTVPMQIAFGLLIGGILGNLVDRVFVGHVIDFVDVHLPFYRWPAFNVADSGICVGVLGYVWMSFFVKQPPAEPVE